MSWIQINFNSSFIRKVYVIFCLSPYILYTHTHTHQEQSESSFKIFVVYHLFWDYLLHVS